MSQEPEDGLPVQDGGEEDHAVDENVVGGHEGEEEECALPSGNANEGHEGDGVMGNNNNEEEEEEEVQEELEDDIVALQRVQLVKIFVKHNVTRALGNELLGFIKNASSATRSSLPTDVRTLRPKKLKYTLVECAPGQLVYFGIKYILTRLGAELFDRASDTINLSVNIDGLPLFHSSVVTVWPISASVGDGPVFIVAFYCGKSKPHSSNDYLRLFVEEVCRLQVAGLTVGGKLYNFKLLNLIADTPAKAMVLCVRGHSGYYSCTKCTTQGERINNTICFPQTDAPPRVSAQYQLAHGGDEAAIDDDMLHDDLEQVALVNDGREPHAVSFHKEYTILADIPGFNLVADVPLDYMHLVCLGVMKRIWYKWFDVGGLYRSQRHSIAPINARLECIREHYTPSEFQRRPEAMKHMAQWKATQYRMLALYIAPAILHNVIETAHFSHFCRLLVALRLLGLDTRKDSWPLDEAGIQYVHKQLVRFVQDCAKLYGKSFVSHNVHSVIHMADDYRRFGPLHRYSSFKYESFFSALKKYVRAGHHPLQQIVTQYSSLLYTQQFASELRPHNAFAEFFEKPNLERPAQMDDEPTDVRDTLTKKFLPHQYERFHLMRFRNFVLRTDNDRRDCYCAIDGGYMRILQILRQRASGDVFLVGKRFETMRNLFTIPTDSLSVGVTVVMNELPGTQMCFIETLHEKCFAMPAGSHVNDDHVILVTYLH